MAAAKKTTKRKNKVKDRRKNLLDHKGGRRKGLRRVEDRRRLIEAMVDDLHKFLEKVNEPKTAKKSRKGRGWGSGKPEAGAKRYERVPVIKSGLTLPPAARRRWLTLADKVRDIGAGHRRRRKGLR